MDKKLRRSMKNNMICGVCAGIANYFNIDVTLVRVIWVVATVLLTAGLGGVIAYFIAAVLMPRDDA